MMDRRFSLSHLVRDRTASGAAEFALVLPLLLILLFGILDGGRFLWETNLAEKATQTGVRMAVVTDILSPGLVSETYVGKTYAGTTLKEGDLIPASALTPMECTSTGCQCKPVASTCPTPGTMDTVKFGYIVSRMKLIAPNITSANVIITYRGSGLGSAGEGGATAMDISPLVTVSLTNLKFVPITTQFFKVAFNLPSFSATLTAEDANGRYSE